MYIKLIDNMVSGDNVTKRLEAFVDERYRSLDAYLYFVPVATDEVYTTAEPLTLDENGKAEYLVSGDVLNGEGYFGVEIVCLNPSGVEIAKSEVYTFYCDACIDDNSAILPTGEVITLAQFKAQLDELSSELESLDASDVGYTDTESLGLDNVQDAIDYALTHGGGSTIPVYTLNWYVEPTPAQQQENLDVINIIRNADPKTYRLYLIVAGRTLETKEIIRSSNSFAAYFTDLYDEETERRYIIESANSTNYTQRSTILPFDTFDDISAAAASQYAIAEYIDTRIGTSGNLDPTSFASASEVAVIEAKIPSAASPTNQLADKSFVNSSVATNTAYFIGTFDSVAELEAYLGTLTNNDYAFVVKYNPTVPTEVDAYDRYKYNAATDEWIFEYELNNSSFTAAQWASINSGMTSSLVSTIGDIEGVIPAEATSANKLADKAYVTSAIDSAIGAAIGGSYEWQTFIRR